LEENGTNSNNVLITTIIIKPVHILFKAILSGGPFEKQEKTDKKGRKKMKKLMSSV
jgi:hypothetical protein